jgi:two-component system, NarL family, nitrate/nitrite response regulator NarL
MKRTIRVFIVEDHPVTVKGLVDLLEGSEKAVFIITGIARTLAEARSAIADKHNRIDIVIQDINLPDGNGVELLRELEAQYPGIKKVVFSVHTSKKIIADCVQAGMNGYLSKLAESKEIISMLCRVMENEDTTIIQAKTNTTDRMAPKITEPVFFADRELQIIRGVLDCKTNKEIEIEISQNTDSKGFEVGNMLRTIYSKAGVEGKAGLVLFALGRNIFPEYQDNPVITEQNGKSSKTIRLVIVEDHEITLRGLKRSLGKAPNIDIVGTATDGEAAEILLQELNGKVDVILTDYLMPKKNGLELTRIIRTRYPGIKVIILSVEDLVQRSIDALQSGAVKYLVKDSSTEKILNMIYEVTDVNHKINQKNTSRGNMQLKKLEFQILSLVLEDMSASRIAKHLAITGQAKISAERVEAITRKIRKIFNVSSIEELAKVCFFQFLKKS